MMLESMLIQLCKGMLTSIEIFVFTLLLSLPLGLVIAWGRMSNIKPIRLLMKVYISIMRGTPLMLQLIVVFFAPYYIFKVSMDRFLAIIVAFVVNYAAYFSEIFRSGINSISKGQVEAAYTLGLNKFQTYMYIILPQVVKKVLPATSNEVVSLIKSTSLAQMIGIAEMFSLAQKQANYLFSITPLILAGGYYLILVGIISFVFSKVEKKLEYYS